MIEEIIEEVGGELIYESALKIKQFFIKALEAAGEIIGDAFNDLKESGNKSKVKLTKVEKELLRKDDIIQIAKDNIVEGYNEVCAWLKEGENGYKLYLAYALNKELLPKEKNNFVIISAEGLSRDASALFKDKELIILK